ncbi:serine hydrolase [uncultured Thiodictyon sp.]|uniref:serine hydrolase n=1 Tax=uncultured Thiodictyon sp. TaxID=1846217 RepID=UPI0025F1E652|nr:serine hydrolase [uncultured Thiodictyon sp.]
MRSTLRIPLFFLVVALALPRAAQVDAQFAGAAPTAAPATTTLALAAPVPEPRPPMPEIVLPRLGLSSASILVVDESDHPVYAKKTRDQRPIASITKLMTAMVVLDAAAPLDEPVTILEEDRDQLRHSRSRLRIDRAATLQRREVLAVALMSSDNRAASALGRTTFPGGKPAFVEAMNRKAATLGMTESRFADPTGLDGNNISTAEDLVKMVRAAASYPLISEITTTGEMEVKPYGDGGTLHYRNTNPLVRSPDWHLELSKTGFVNEAGHCLVMRAVIGGRLLSIVLLDSPGKRNPVGDSIRLRKWLESQRSGLSGSG